MFEGLDARIRAEEKGKSMCMCACVYVCVCMRACGYACVCVCVCVDLGLFFTPSYQNGRNSERNDRPCPRACTRCRYVPSVSYKPAQ